MAVFPTIGYSDPDQSRFTSVSYWEVGKLDANMRTGWMGACSTASAPTTTRCRSCPWTAGSRRAWRRPRQPVAAIEGTEYDLWAPGVWDDTQVSDEMFVALEDIGDAHALNSEGGRRPAGRVTQQATGVRTQLSAFGDVTPPPAYPTERAGLAAMLHSGLDIRCAALSAAGGYDTHDNQDANFGEDVGVTSQALKAFQQDLEAKGLADRVITLVSSSSGAARMRTAAATAPARTTVPPGARSSSASGSAR